MASKRIVLGTDDRMYLSGDFERSRYFAVYELADGDVQDESFLPNPLQIDDAGRELTDEQRTALLQALGRPDVVITRRIDPELKMALKEAGVEVRQVLDQGRIAVLLFRYVQNQLMDFPEE